MTSQSVKVSFQNLFKSTYEVARNISNLLAEGSEILSAGLSSDVLAFEEFLKKKLERCIEDKCGRTAVHLAASYNSYLHKVSLSLRY